MSVFRPSASTRRQRRRTPRPLTAALVELLRAHRPSTTDESDVWVCLTPATASAIARVAARREGSLAGYRDHPAHRASRQPVRVCAATATQWRPDAWQAADEGLIGVDDARALAAQIDAPEVP